MKTKLVRLKTVFILFLSFQSSLLFSQVSVLNLNRNWQFRQAGTENWLAAEVPGCVHTDLLRNKVIGDPFYRTNEKDLQWIGEKDWEYRTTFVVPDSMLRKENLNLVFKGLDTYADVYLNDSLIIRAGNMHREWRKDCLRLLRKGENRLMVYFHSVFKIDVPKYLRAPYKLQAWPNNDQGDMWLSVYARKAGYEYGWDWGPRLITSGIWRPVFIEGWDRSRISDVHIVQKLVSREKAVLSAVCQIESDGTGAGLLRIKNNGKVMAEKKIGLQKGTNTVILNFNIDHPKLWWTNGLGNPDLYTFKCELSNKEGADSKTVTTGIRSVKIIREADKYGKSFYVLLNGVRVFIKGSNYIPIDNFVNRVTPARYDEVIRSARDANMNMLRVWGGGIYENDIFYDLCDRNGILVWQDMMFACGMFPSDSAFVGNVKQEVKENVIRLRNHPCIALWCGNNENEISWYGWGWKAKYPDVVQREYENGMHRLFDEEIPSMISSLDSGRYYHPSSPSTAFNNIGINTGDSHYYGVWSVGEPFEEYGRHVARFMSEYGFQSFPEYKSVARFAQAGDLALNSPVMLAHQRAKDNDTREDFGNRNIEKYMDMYFRHPKDFRSFLYVGQVLQAKGIVMAIEAHRRNMPFCMGTMYWQLNDCWPVASWSGTDYYGRWKALHYAVRDAYRKEMISVVNEKGKLRVYIASDGLKAQRSMLELKLLTFDGKPVSDLEKDIVIDPNTSKVYFETDTNTLIRGQNLRNLVLNVKLKNGKETLAFKNFYFLSEKELDLPSVMVEKSIKKEKDDYIIRLSSSRLAKSVYLFSDENDGFFSDNYFDLLPGEVKVIRFRPAKGEVLDINKLQVMSLSDSY